MKTFSRFGVLAVLLVSMVGWSLPASAGSPLVPVGDQLVLTGCFTGAGGPDAPAAGEPFHVVHGWLWDLDGSAHRVGWSDFQLFVDGEEQPSRLLVTVGEPEGMRGLTRTFLSNFPDGLPSGSYEFRGVWTGWEEGVESTYECTHTLDVVG